MSVEKITNIIYDFKEKLTDLEYISVMNELKKIYNTQTNKPDDYKFYKQKFYHSLQANAFFMYIFCEQDNTIRCCNLKQKVVKNLKNGDEIVYNQEKKCKILKINPKYTIIEIDNQTTLEKISNTTLCKILYYPYVSKDHYDNYLHLSTAIDS